MLCHVGVLEEGTVLPQPWGWDYWSVRKEEGQVSKLFHFGKKSRATASLSA